jgi:hypothetical protein
MLCKQTIIVISGEVTTRSNPVEFYKKGYGSERVVLPLMMMMIGRRDGRLHEKMSRKRRILADA